MLSTFLTRKRMRVTQAHELARIKIFLSKAVKNNQENQRAAISKRQYSKYFVTDGCDLNTLTYKQNG